MCPVLVCLENYPCFRLGKKRKKEKKLKENRKKALKGREQRQGHKRLQEGVDRKRRRFWITGTKMQGNEED